jgi:hypothetical protein
MQQPKAWTEKNLEAILATAAKLLVRYEAITAASVLTNAVPLISSEHSDWGSVICKLNLAVPTEVYFELKDTEKIEDEINDALGNVITAYASSDIIRCRIVAAIEEDDDWRNKINQLIFGQGVTNQGRVRSDNIATRQRDGLLFRSQQEINFYDALKREGIPFAPLSVVLKGGLEYRRVEPDFVIYKDGMVMIVEIDGDLYHSETPAAAHARLKFLTDEGARLERITASECDTPEKAREAVARIVATIHKLRGFPKL